ncbi:MAG: helix-turn-helix domain-containing protein [Gemmatimonadaceae bacterium]
MDTAIPGGAKGRLDARRETKRTALKKAAPTLGEAIVQGLQEAVAYEQGELPDVTVTRVTRTARTTHVAPPENFTARSIAALRKHLRLSQTVFAAALNVKADTVRSWEQGKREPEGAAVRLLELAQEDPRWVYTRIAERHTEPVRTQPATRNESVAVAARGRQTAGPRSETSEGWTDEKTGVPATHDKSAVAKAASKALGSGKVAAKSAAVRKGR